LGMQSQAGGTRHLRLNKGKRPIANKYREGKMKRTLKRESKVREIAARETNVFAGAGLRRPSVKEGRGVGARSAREVAFSGMNIERCMTHTFRTLSRAKTFDPS